MATNIFWMATKFVCTGIKSFWRATKFNMTLPIVFWKATLFVWMAPNNFWRATKISMTLPTVFWKATLFVYTGTKSGRRGVFFQLDSTTGGRYRLFASRQRKYLQKKSGSKTLSRATTQYL